MPEPMLFENPLQLGGIRTGTLDDPQPLGRPGCRVALVDTGSGLRFTVAIDRGGDIVDAVYNDCPLAFLTPNGLKRPEEAYQHDTAWLRSWPGGLVTTCGPMHIGAPIAGDATAQGLHGHHSNTPAAVLSVCNPDPTRGRRDMAIAMTIRDSRMFGPTIEVRRQIRSGLGESRIEITDEVTNLGDEPTPHHWLYHINLGYPLLAPGATLQLPGREEMRWGDLKEDPDLDWRTVPAPLQAHHGSGEGGIVLIPERDAEPAVATLANVERNLTLEVRFRSDQLPRIAHWRHYGPRGSYVCGIEPFAGKLLPDQPDDGAPLEPGETRRYDLQILVRPSTRNDKP